MGSHPTRAPRALLLLVLLTITTGLIVPRAGAQAIGEPLKTPLSQDLLTLLTNEISGQIAFNNLVKLAGAPWLRDPGEFDGTLYEAETLFEMVQSYGIETVSLERHPAAGTYDYPSEGELWVVEPGDRLIARLGADAALVASGSRTADVTGQLIFIPPLDDPDRLRGFEAEATGRLQGRIALMWSHPRDAVARALDAAGIQAVISFNSRERYFDPNQVVYSRGSYGEGDNLQLGLTVSWRQWSELLEDVQRGERIVMRARAVVDQHPNKYETVFAWIPGTEPEERGVVFTGHLFEGYVKRGTNDNAGAPIVQLEILRALEHLIETGQIPRPRRTIYFIWPNEIGGTYEFIKQTPGFADKLSININMDMVTEGLRNANSVFTMSETPAHLPSYLDGLAASILSYVWRTNDIVYLPDSPRGRPGGQYFPAPMVEKNGSLDAFRFYVHEATGGSDHICFNNPSVAVPAIEFFTWPDQWYHADADLPDKADPTEMRRVAFIGAASAWAAANLTDEVLPGMVDAVSDFGYARVAERGIPAAHAFLDDAMAAELSSALVMALNKMNRAVDREVGALESIREVYSGSAAARALLDARMAQWALYRDGLQEQLRGYAGVRARQLGAPAPEAPGPSAADRRFAEVIPALHPDVRGREFYLERGGTFAAALDQRRDDMNALGLTSAQTRSIHNFINGKYSVVEIRDWVLAQTGQGTTTEQVAGYVEILEEVGWVVIRM